MKYLLIFLSFITLTTEPILELKKATLEDTGGLMHLIDNISPEDYKKMVILPGQFRQSNLESNIQGGKLFVARDNERPIAYKKLYLMTREEAKKVCTSEIRCI
ncbi:MAG TPA: hypothetical protein QGF02_01385 [Candidatus Babeliales bacterium]|nr:hypothetical protein [Candidatus Babeliales bacterium]